MYGVIDFILINLPKSESQKQDEFSSSLLKDAQKIAILFPSETSAYY